MENLSDPTAGEVRVAASLPMAAGILPVIVDRLSRRHPRIAIHAREVPIGLLQFQTPTYRDLRERAVDLVLGPIVALRTAEDLETELLFSDTLIVATGKQNRWIRRRAVKLRDLIDEPWCLPSPDTPAGLRCVEAFRLNGLDVPTRNVTSLSLHLQLGLLATQRFFTMFPGSLMRFGADRLSIKGLPIKLAVQPIPVGIITLKDRTISPAAQLFIQVVWTIKPTLNRNNEGPGFCPGLLFLCSRCDHV